MLPSAGLVFSLLPAGPRVKTFPNRASREETCGSHVQFFNEHLQGIVGEQDPDPVAVLGERECMRSLQAFYCTVQVAGADSQPCAESCFSAIPICRGVMLRLRPLQLCTADTSALPRTLSRVAAQ